MVVSLLTAKPNKRMLYEFDHYMDDPLPGTLPSGTVLVDEPMEAHGVRGPQRQMTRACCAVGSYGRGVAFLWFGRNH